MIIIGGALLAGFLSASSTDFADAPRQSSCEHPLSALPSGWIHVPQRTVDTWTGAFHDSLSGAFASFDVTTTANTASESRANGNGAETTQGIADGIPYEVTRTVDPATTGAQNAAPDVRGAPALKGTVAPDRARISVSFRSAARVWVFRATAYSRLQEERVRALLLGSDARLCHMQPTEDPGHETVVAAHTYRLLRHGSPASAVLALLGRPQGSQPRGPDGLALWYLVSDGPSGYRHARLDFDKSQRLQEKTLDAQP